MFSIPFWNWFWHISGLIAILAICLPSKVLKKISLQLSIYHAIPPETVVDMTMHDCLVPSADQAVIIDAYNHANFLYRKPRVPGTEGLPALTWRKAKRKAKSQTKRKFISKAMRKDGPIETYTLVPNGLYVDVIKHAGNRTTVFTIQSDTLRQYLQSTNEAGRP